ncbi:MAG: beta-lactamase family protein, partial [Caldilineaceae bacterium]|nr:beta-lactamase family protein [Caldilineaceae bacterium]
MSTEPGARYLYSGAGYWVVQQIIEEVTGDPFAAAMQKLVLEPLGMTASTFVEPDDTVAAAHDGNGAVTFDKWTRHPGKADGGLWTTPTDLAQYAVEVMRAYSHDGGCILNQQVAQAMLTPQAGFHGLGPFMTGSGDRLQFNHGGAGEGFLCRLVAFPARSQGAAIMTNGANGWPLILELLRSLA